MINDPVYGLVEIPSALMFDLIEHPYFQRLRRISQLGLTGLVYPGALHTRFHHAIGAMHLMQRALHTLKAKGVTISDEEHEAVSVAILLHDIGHGPYSHALEHSLMDIHHEAISLAFMHQLNTEFAGRLTLAIQIFRGEYHRPFFHQLISGQIDMDRLDYLRRDSFYTGVSEGTVGIDRIIQMLQVKDDKLVVEEKAIYSIEKFLMARRLMYWQVYFHKTVIAAEGLLINILKRARHLASQGFTLEGTTTLKYFLYHQTRPEQLSKDPQILDTFGKLDDFDLMAGIKEWTRCGDPILAALCDQLATRRLPKVKLQSSSFTEVETLERLEEFGKLHSYSTQDAGYFLYTDSVSIHAYSLEDEIIMLMKDGSILPYSKLAESYGLKMESLPVKKYYMCTSM